MFCVLHEKKFKIMNYTWVKSLLNIIVNTMYLVPTYFTSFD